MSKVMFTGSDVSVYMMSTVQKYAASTLFHCCCSEFISIKMLTNSIVKWFLWTIEHTNSSLDISKQLFAHHGLCMPDKARDGRNVALNYQVNCWCARLSKGTILLSTQHAL